MTIHGKRMLSVAESAAYIGKSTKTVRRYLKRGLLPGEKVNGKFGPEICCGSNLRILTHPVGFAACGCDYLVGLGASCLQFCSTGTSFRSERIQ